ncbi:hypothetical protein [Ornatilinea apprima]|uniref:hypothetical protein n=1 Tax=Ornatilinea apprima TaxID=1134406 RepID=UPI00128EB264|nr:hypothetical protein [Ornatilinea apprima]
MTQWLASVRRTLNISQRAEVLDKFEKSQCNPLYLKLAFEEARLWTSFQPQETLAAGVAGIIRENMIERLKDEGNHGEMLVSRALGYLAASRYGLAEDELVDLLSRDLEVYTWFFKQTYHLPSDLVQRAAEYLHDHPDVFVREREPDAEASTLAWLNELKQMDWKKGIPEPLVEFLATVLPQANGPHLPVVLWSRLSFDLAPFLTERLVDGSSLLAFYHRELRDASEAEFLSDGQAQAYHAKLADYFRFKADPDGDHSWSGDDIHGLSELPYHLTEAERWDQVYRTLIDFRFLEEKAARVGVVDSRDGQGQTVRTYTGVLRLQEDYERALAAMPGGRGSESWGDRSPLIVTARQKNAEMSVDCPVCHQTLLIKDEMLGTVITCPQQVCQARLKLNAFVIQTA